MVSEMTSDAPESVTGGGQNPVDASETSLEAEIQAMSELANVLAPLQTDARDRVLQWVIGRFGSTAGHRGVGSPTSQQATRAAFDELEAPANRADPDGFDDFADLYDAAVPRTEAERALVAAYWASRDKRDFRAQEVNGLLKDLGFGVGNITDALNTLMTRKPNEVMQTRKSGASRQSRKDYRLTKAGNDRLREMLTRVTEDARDQG